MFDMKFKIAFTTFLFFLFSIFAFHLSYSCPADSTTHTVDSISVKQSKPSTMNDTWYHSAEPERHYVIDSSIFHLEEYNEVERDGIESMNIGNNGTAAFPMVYSMDKSTGFNVGYNQFDIYRYQKDSIRYYQVIRPYVELTMCIGLNYNQMFKVKFANQHKGLFYYGVDFTRIYSTGIYQGQRANDNGFSLYGIYNSKNKHWNIDADLIFNSFRVQENGGVKINPFDSTLFQKNLVPITDVGQNIYNQISFYLTSSYSIGKSYYARKNDTLRVKTLLPVFKVSHLFNIEKSSFSYRDYYPDTVNYEKFFSPDSVYNDFHYLKVGNAIQLEYRPRSLTSDSTYSEKDFIAYAEAGVDYYLVWQNGLHHSFDNLYVGGTFRNNYASKAHIIYRATAKYYLAGYNQNDLMVDGLVGYDFNKLGILSGNATFQLKQAPYIFEHYYYPRNSWSDSLSQTAIFNVGGKYQNPRYGIVADLNYYVASYIPTTPGVPIPYVTKSPESAFVLHFGNRNGIAGLHFDNDLWFTITPPPYGYINSMFPMFYSKHSLYYEHRVFKGAFWFATGFDVRLRYSTNSGPYYEPLLGTFAPVTTPNPTYQFSNFPIYPLVDFFVNFKIKTVRIFLKVTNVTSPIDAYYGYGYSNFYKYPAADLSFAAGVTWRFFD